MIPLEEFVSELGGGPALLLSAGLVVGLLHAFEPDHVAAIAAQTSRVRGGRAETALSRASAVKGCVLGALWGFGHTSTILLVGVLVLVFSLSLPDQLFAGFEVAVGAMLIALGVYGWWRKAPHSHPHTHDDGTIHSHPHTHCATHSHGHKSYLVGCVHGLAGSGGMMALASSVFGDVHTALTLLLVFGVGSTVGMATFSGVLNIPFRLAGSSGRLQKYMRIGTGAISIAVGLAVVYGVFSTLHT